ncbi:MAG: class I SAM-dependent methyltransferase [Gammaproteobacteria bacterium]|nr:class I SAM-dependent methyltransferase [Gammaproteobacteria bacterium]
MNYSESELIFPPATLEDDVMAHELSLMRTLIPDLFGYHLLQVGGDRDLGLLAGSRIGHRLGVVLPHSDGGRELPLANGFYAEASALPLQAESVDVVLLPHTLEQVADPHGLLREVERVLIPEGRLLITAFNPLSSWGVRHFWQQRQRQAPARRRLISTVRLGDWMNLLGMETLQINPYLFLPPLRRVMAASRLRRVEQLGQRYLPYLCGGYLLLAKKRLSTLTPIGPRWRQQRQLIGLKVSDVATRQGEISYRYGDKRRT